MGECDRQAQRLVLVAQRDSANGLRVGHSVKVDQDEQGAIEARTGSLLVQPGMRFGGNHITEVSQLAN
jgi:hypothetical protein